MSVEEHHIGQLYTVAKQSVAESTGSTAVEILINEPFFDPIQSELSISAGNSSSSTLNSSVSGTSTSTSNPSSTASSNPSSTKSSDRSTFHGIPTSFLCTRYNSGQYTQKVYHVGGHLPGWCRSMAPASMLKVVERAWNCYPYCRTVMTNDYLGEDRFFIVVESMHIDDLLGKSNVDSDNVFGLSKDQLKKREVYYLNIGGEPTESDEYLARFDPRFYKSERTGRGPFDGDWRERQVPRMTVYKLVTIRCAIFGFQSRIEKLVLENQCKIFNRFYKRTVCEMDEWWGLSMEDIRKLEEETRKILDKRLDEFGLPTRSLADRQGLSDTSLSSSTC